MSDEQFIVNEGDGAKLIPVQSKEPTLVSDDKLKEMAAHEEATTKDVAGPLAISSELLAKRKRGRPKKVAAEVKPEKIWYCSTCRKTISDKNVMRIGAGENRYAVFCSECQRSFGFEDQTMLDTVAKLIRDNPTGK
jgi:hypothetical protein